MNVVGLVFLVFFIYSILGVFLFKDVTEGRIFNQFTSFSKFGVAMITLFRCATGEDWHLIMQDMSVQSPFAKVYFLSFITITPFVMLNLFILVLVEQFEDNFSNPDNPLENFNSHLEIFRHSWAEFTLRHQGKKIDKTDLTPFFSKLESPLGKLIPTLQLNLLRIQ